ncbi:MAG: S-adenosylmethionine decarboxylase [Gemmatimonadales bacterium]
MPVTHQLVQLTDITSPLLADEQGMAALAIAAAGAIGLSAYGPPTTRTGPLGSAVALLAHGGHIILHSAPATGCCIVDVLAPGTLSPRRAIEVIARRLGTTAPAGS